MDEILEDKGMIGGPGPVMPRKPKAGISMQKAYGFLVRTRVRIPPAPPKNRETKRKEIVDHQFRKQNLRKGGTDRQKDNIVSFIKDVIYK